MALGGEINHRYAIEMKTYIALLRGINVGGQKLLLMSELASMLENIGLRNVETYVQSGNVVFQSEETNVSLLADTIRAAVKKSSSFEPQVLLLKPRDIEKAVRENPFPEAESEPKTLHLFFLSSEPRSLDLDALESIKSSRERFTFKDGVFYLHAPDGIGRSRLAANAEKLLGVPMTGRNWRTVRKIMEMAQLSG